jgi:hypothetical protein
MQVKHLRRKEMKKLLFGLVIVTLLISACGEKAPETTPTPAPPTPTPIPPTPTPVPPVEVHELTVTFERDKCIYDGPKVIRQGEVTIIFNNLTDATADVVVGRFENGKTWQDLVDVLSETNRGVRPEWVSRVSYRPVMNDYRAKIFNLEPGLYAITCSEILQGTWAVWLASPLEVR